MDVTTGILYGIRTRMMFFTKASDAEGMELAMVIPYLLCLLRG